MSQAKPKVQLRLPPSPAEFVARGDERPAARAPRRADAQTPKRRNVVQRAEGRRVDRFSVYLPEALGQQLREACVRHRVEISEAVAAAVRAWLARDS